MLQAHLLTAQRLLQLSGHSAEGRTCPCHHSAEREGKWLPGKGPDMHWHEATYLLLLAEADGERTKLPRDNEAEIRKVSLLTSQGH